MNNNNNTEDAATLLQFLLMSDFFIRERKASNPVADNKVGEALRNCVHTGRLDFEGFSFKLNDSQINRVKERLRLIRLDSPSAFKILSE